MTAVCASCGWCVIIAVEVPDCCEKCGRHLWHVVEEPSKEFVLSPLDRRLLKALRISAR